jgi:hypothetical protein
MELGTSVPPGFLLLHLSPFILSMSVSIAWPGSNSTGDSVIGSSKLVSYSILKIKEKTFFSLSVPV